VNTLVQTNVRLTTRSSWIDLINGTAYLLRWAALDSCKNRLQRQSSTRSLRGVRILAPPRRGSAAALPWGLWSVATAQLRSNRGQWQRGVHQHLSGVNGNAHGMQLSRWSPAGRRRGWVTREGGSSTAAIARVVRATGRKVFLPPPTELNRCAECNFPHQMLLTLKTVTLPEGVRPSRRGAASGGARGGARGPDGPTMSALSLENLSPTLHQESSPPLRSFLSRQIRLVAVPAPDHRQPWLAQS
jgi:hypothetical protein